jgi:hypothetical protein
VATDEVFAGSPFGAGSHGALGGPGLVGRDRELGQLRGALGRLAAGWGTFVVVNGEAGMGKTALVRCVVEEAAAAGLPTCVISCRSDTAHHDESSSGRDASAVDMVGAVVEQLPGVSPQLVAIDDLDLASSEVVSAVRRLVEHPARRQVLVVATVRGPRWTARQRNGADLAYLDLATCSLTLGELCEADVLRLAEHLGLEPAPERLPRASAAPGQGSDALLDLAVSAGGVPAIVTAVLHAPDAATARISVGRAAQRWLALLDGDARLAAELVTLLTPSATVSDVTVGLGSAPRIAARALEGAEALGLVHRDGHLVRLRSEALVEGLADGVWTSSDATRATEAVRRVAAGWVAAGRFVAAEALLGVAVSGNGTSSDLGLLLDHADATRRTGYLGRSRQQFAALLARAEASTDIPTAAMAALGLGGIWVNEHRGAAASVGALAGWLRVRDAMRGEVRGVPDLVLLELRLDMRIAAERAYLTHQLGDVEVALDAIRATGNPAALVEALSLYHHLLLGPGHGAMRRQVVAEMIAAAFAGGDESHILNALCWQAVDAYLEGSRNADRRLEVLRDRLAGCPVLAFQFIVQCLDVMRMIRAVASRRPRPRRRRASPSGKRRGMSTLSRITAHSCWPSGGAREGEVSSSRCWVN